jgi:hypothetical protein
MGHVRILLFVILACIGGIAHADGDPLCRAFSTLPDYFSHPKAVVYVKTGAVEEGFNPKFSREFYAAILGMTDDLAKLLVSRDKTKPLDTDILRETVESGEAASLKLLLQAGVSPEYGGEEGGTALLAAIQCNEPMMLSYLLVAGADVYWHNKTFGDAMIAAVGHDSIGNARLLLLGGYDPACASYLGPQHAIEMMANRLGDADMVSLLSSFREIRASSNPKKLCALPARDRTPLPEPNFKLGGDFGGPATSQN